MQVIIVNFFMTAGTGRGAGILLKAGWIFLYCFIVLPVDALGKQGTTANNQANGNSSPFVQGKWLHTFSKLGNSHELLPQQHGQFRAAGNKSFIEQAEIITFNADYLTI
jgi:hypothetical protein